MKKITLLLVTLFLLTQATVYAQQKTLYGDEVGTLDGIIKSYYDVVTVKKGEKVSYKRDSLLHVSNPSVGMVKRDKDGKIQLALITLKQFHENSDAELEKNGFYEREVGRKVENFGAVYHVWSTYETRNTVNGPIINRGINSIQLYFDGTRFWILSWVFDEESKEQPIPKKYLKTNK
jgi:hypothetical protein